MALNKFTDLVLDVGGVLFSFSIESNTALPPITIKKILTSAIWHEYERGKLSQQKCYHKISLEFSLAPGVWEAVVCQLKSTLKPNDDFIQAIKHLKTVFPGLRIHAFSNSSVPDFDTLKATIDGWAIFESVTTSTALGSRKPEFDAYRKLQELAKIEAHTTIFVDDQSINAITAHSLGFHGLLFDDTNHTATQLHNLIGDPVSRGMDFLHRNSQNLWCETSHGIIHKDNFSQLLILQCIGDRLALPRRMKAGAMLTHFRDLVTLENDGDTWQFHIEVPSFTDDIPNDADTTSLAMVTLEVSNSQKERVMETILLHRTPEGLPLMYFDNMRPRVNPPAAANILRFFFLNGQGSKLQTTLQYLCRILSADAYEIDDLYYLQADWMFYYLADLCGRCSDPELNQLRTLLKVKLQERMGCDKDVMGVAMRVLAAQSLKLSNPRDLSTLLHAQQIDGGWEIGWLWKYIKYSTKIGSRAVPTAMAIKALRTAFGTGNIR